MEVKLSQKTFKALANPTRIAVLKLLDKRNHTQSEISKVLGFAVPTIKQHINDLQKADLVEMVDDGRKWKYIKLTKEGKAILHPEEKKIWILLGTFAVGIVGSILAFTKKIVSPVTQKMSPMLEDRVFEMAEETVATGTPIPAATSAIQEVVVQSTQIAEQEIVNQAVQAPIAPIMTQPPLTSDIAAQTLQQIPILVYIFIAIAILSALGLLIYLIKRQKRKNWLKKLGSKGIEPKKLRRNLK